MTSSDIKFDKQVLQVGMAKEYLKQKLEFHSTEAHQSKNIIIEYDDYNNKIFLNSDFQEPPSSTHLFEGIKDKSIKKKLMDLAERITKKIELFCQLEYLIRKIPMDETRNIELKLLTQNLFYQSTYENVDNAVISEIYMTATTPLSILGSIAQLTGDVTIVSSKETAVICTLFNDLCHEAGLSTSLQLVKTLDPPATTTKMSATPVSLSFKELSSRSVGIVTEKADIDSAVDSFLYSSSRYPWRISKIYVQECVLSRFKRSIKWKTKKASEDEHHARQCTSAHAHEDKVYLFEFVGNDSELSDKAVVIEAYRTNKELISLMSKKRPFCVSLWSCDVAGSNEIAFAVDSNTVWINDFGCFDGPPITSQGYYSLIYKILDERKNANYLQKSDKDNVLKLRNLWLKLDVSTRYQKVLKACQHFLAGHEDCKDEMELKITNNSTIDVGKNVCVSIQKPVDVQLLYVETYQEIFKYMNYVIEGGAVLFIVGISPDVDKVTELCKILSDSNVPVGLVKDEMKDNSLYFPCKLRYNTKVVWSSIGTIFAN